MAISHYARSAALAIAAAGTQLEQFGYASCLGRPLSVASPSLLYGAYADTQIVELVPAINGYSASIVATLPQGDVAPVAADLAVSPVTFPAPEPSAALLAVAALGALAALRRVAGVSPHLPPRGV